MWLADAVVGKRPLDVDRCVDWSERRTPDVDCWAANECDEPFSFKLMSWLVGDSIGDSARHSDSESESPSTLDIFFSDKNVDLYSSKNTETHISIWRKLINYLGL